MKTIALLVLVLCVTVTLSMPVLDEKKTEDKVNFLWSKVLAKPVDYSFNIIISYL